jgi:hypothetical protein
LAAILSQKHIGLKNIYALPETGCRALQLLHPAHWAVLVERGDFAVAVAKAFLKEGSTLLE